MRERCELRLTEAPGGMFQGYCNCGGWIPVTVSAPAAIMLNAWLDHLCVEEAAYTIRSMPEWNEQ